MKILYLSNLYPPNAIGGYEQLCFKVASSLVDRGHEAVVCTGNYGSRESIYSGQRVTRGFTLFTQADNIYVPLNVTSEERGAIELSNAEAFREICRREKPDLVFVWNLYFLSAALLDVVSTCDIPVAYFLTDNWLAALTNPGFVANYFKNEVYQAPNFFRRWRRRNRNMTGVRRVAGTAIFSSHFMRKFYKTAGVEFTNHRIIHNGVQFKSEGALVPKRIDRSQLRNPGELSLLFAGRVVEIKGLLSAVRAMPLIVKSCSDVNVTFTILGDQQDREFVKLLENECERLGVADKIKFRPPVPESEVVKIFDDHDVYLFPSLYEPFSLTLLHAMHAGIPIVASDAGGNIEAIRNGSTGLIYKAHDSSGLAAAVKRLSGSPRLRMKISHSAIEASKAFTFERMIAELESTLKGLK